MRELEERENRAGYQEELEERLALAGCRTARDAMKRRETLDQVVDPEDEDLDEDELEDEEELLRLRAHGDETLYQIGRRLGGEPPPAPRRK